MSAEKDGFEGLKASSQGGIPFMTEEDPLGLLPRTPFHLNEQKTADAATIPPRPKITIICGGCSDD